VRTDAELTEIFDSVVGQEADGVCEGCDAHSIVATVDHPADCPAICDSYSVAVGDRVWWWIFHHSTDRCFMWRAKNARSN
jgi:hypothetical protein